MLPARARNRVGIGVEAIVTVADEADILFVRPARGGSPGAGRFLEGTLVVLNHIIARLVFASPLDHPVFIYSLAARLS